MRWKGRGKSRNVEDRRGMSPKGALMGGGIGMIVLLVAVVFLKIDPSVIMGQLGGGGGGAGPGAPADPGNPDQPPPETEMSLFVKTVLRDTEDIWGELFPAQLGKEYREPTLVLFTGQVHSACGTASSAVGPFYCPGDHKVYIDLSFYDQLAERLGAPGDFAQAYVLAHEVGHHVQSLLGISKQVHDQQQRVSKTEANGLSVRLELQADFFAGVWAHHAQRKWGVLETGDYEEAIRAASAIGDDRLQKQAQGYVVPDSFTHGSSAQRIAWFRHGFETGDVNQGNTFDDAHYRRINPR